MRVRSLRSELEMDVVRVLAGDTVPAQAEPVTGIMWRSNSRL